MPLNTLTPRMYNTDYISLQQVSRSVANRSAMLSDASYENFILFNLAKDISPTDISVNRTSMPRDLSLNLSNTNIEIASPSDPNGLIDNVIFNNDDTYIQSESFAMNVKYSSGSSTSAKTDSYVIVGPSSRIPSNINLTSSSSPLYDSNLKMDFTLNNSVQDSTTPSSTVNALNERWRVEFDRQYNNMNYFATINSNLNTVSNVYPFNVLPDLSINLVSINGEDNDSAVYFTREISNGRRTAVNFAGVGQDMSRNTLAANSLKMYVDDGYINYNGSEFKTYKIEQSDNGLGVLIQILNGNNYITGTRLPIGQYTTGADVVDGGNWLTFADISKNISTLHPSNPSNIDSGFTAILTVGNVTTGGYTATSSLFDLCDNNLTTTGSARNLNYFTNHKALGTHYVDISNGSVTISDSPNRSFITISTGEETLDSSFCSTSGRIVIEKTVKDTSNNTNGRVSFLYDLSSDLITPTGLRSSFTDMVTVYNSETELPSLTYADGLGTFSKLSTELAQAADVSYNVKLLIESTNNGTTLTYNELDSRNLARNTPVNGTDIENTRLVIANPNKPIGFNISPQTSFTMNEGDSSNKIRRDNTISILNIQNTCNLVNDGSLCSGLNSDGIDISYSTVVPGVSCKVDLIDTDISTFKYYDYRVILKTKTATDLSNSMAPINNWSFTLSTLENDRLRTGDVSGFLIGNPQRVSEIIYNDAVFLQGQTNVDIRYTFSVDPIATSLNSTRYNFDASLNDITRGSQEFNYKFGGSTDITFDDIIDFSDIKLSTISSGITGSTNYAPADYIFEKWLRRKQYKAQINPSLPYYENLLLKTENVYEESFYYRAWSKSGNNKSFEVSSLILKQFTLSGSTLEQVQVQLVNSFGSIGQSFTNSVIRSYNPTTTITLKPKDCCIFFANLQGKDLSNNKWEDLGYDSSNNIWTTTRAEIDPFILQTGTIHDYNTTSGAAFSCVVNVVFPTTSQINNNFIIVKSSKYYIGITNKIGVNTSLTANLYSFTYADIANNTSLSNYLSPYNNKFDQLPTAFRSTTSYSCDLSLNNNVYTLTVSHLNNAQKYIDTVITFPNDFVLNFNIVSSPKNLISITKKITGSMPTVSYDNLTMENGNRIVKVDEGVFLTLVANATYGMEESFLLKKDKINVQFINNITNNYDASNGNYYKNNNTYWADISGTTLKYKPIVFNSASNLTIVNSESTNKTKSIIFNRVRGYNMESTYNDIDVNRNPATYKFVLDVSYTIPQHVDTSNGLPVLIKKVSPFDLLYAKPVGDVSRNTMDTSYNRATLVGGDLSLNYIPYVVIDASSNWSVRDNYENSIDSSYNYKFERQIYQQIWNSGVSSFNINDVTSTGTISTESAATNTVESNIIHLDIGLLLKPTRSILSNAEDQANNRLVPINVTAANYSYSFFNPVGSIKPIINGDGSGNLFEGMITNFMNIKSRSVKAAIPFQVKVIYAGSLIRIFTADTYTTKPNQITTWTQIPTSPFTQNQLSLLTKVSLNPTIFDGPFNIKLQRTATNNNAFTAYFVCAPPAVKITYIPINTQIISLPIPVNTITSNKKEIYYDITKNNEIINLRTIVNNTTYLNADVRITTPTISFDAYRRMSISDNVPYNFIINGNNINISLYSGVNAPQQNAITYYVDSSLNKSTNVTDVSYSFTVFTDSSNQLVYLNYPTNTDSTIYSGPINFITNYGNLLRVVRSSNTVGYDISLCQPVSQFLTGITNNAFNINFIIDNAFIPPNTSYLPLQTSRSSAVSFFDSNCRFNNGKYYVFLNKYSMTAATNYETILANNTNVSTISFMIDKVEQKALELFTDSSNIHPLINSSKTISDPSHNKLLVDNITFDDINTGSWTIVEDVYRNIGITLSAINTPGVQGIRDFLVYNISSQIDNKTLFINRADIFRVSSAFGEPVFRITNSGNIIAQKITTSMLSLFQQSITTENLFPGLNTATLTDDQLYLSTSDAKLRGIYSQNSLDFSGNLLKASSTRPPTVG